MTSYTNNCAEQEAASNPAPGLAYVPMPEPTGKTRNIYVGGNDALLLPGKSYRIPFSGVGPAVYMEGGYIGIDTEGEIARAFIHKAEMEANGAGVVVVTTLDAPVSASQILAGSLPQLEAADFTDVVEFIGDFSITSLALGIVLGALFLWSIR